MSSLDEQSSYMEPSSPIERTQSGLAASFVMPSLKKTEGKADRAVDDKPYIDERKLSTTKAANSDSNSGLSPKITDGNADQVVNDEPFVDERKPSSMTAVKVNLHNGESDVTQRMQKNSFFLNDVTQDTDARKKYSLQTLLAGKLFLQII